MAQALSTGETVRAEEMVLSAPDGRSVRTLINATPIRTEGGAVGSVVVTMQDLAPFDEIERLRTEFLGLVSHELRAPLASITGSAVALLEDGPRLDPAEMREFLRIIVEQAGQMRGLISDLLDAGRIDSGTLSVATEPSEVADPVERARDTFLSGGGRHAVLVDLPPGLPRVMADRRRIVQVLNNLFSNAARHAPESTPSGSRPCERTRTSRSRSPTRVGAWRPSCCRTCFGSTPAARGRGRRRATASGSPSARGSSKRTATASGRRAPVPDAVRRSPSRSRRAGSPAPRRLATPPARRRAGRAAAHPGGGRGPADAALRPRRAVGGRLRPARDGVPHDLARIIRTERPRLVLLDLMLPDIDGIELMQQVPELSDLPVIFISGYGRDETVAKALESGADDYIVKPFSPTELVARVRAALRRREEPEPFVLGDLAIDYEHRAG